MKRLLIGHDTLVTEWVRRRIPHMQGRSFGDSVAIGVIDGENLLGGVVFHGYCKEYRGVEWSAASDTAGWLNREVISAIMDYPFGTLGCVRITAAIPKKNKRAIEFQRRFGFVHEGTLRRGFGNQDALLFGLLKSDWARSPFNINRTTTPRVAEPADARH